MIDNAYLPDSMKTGCLAEDYQRVANEIRDRGTILEWVNDRPMMAGFDASYMFMYPTVVKAENISPEAT